MSRGFVFWKWHIHICVTRRKDAYAVLKAVMEDALIFGRGYVGISPEDVEAGPPPIENPEVPSP